ncbi:hypothetical protein TH53_12195 [Pedobacter lusitanus]|uniref:Uncharacterized protein n=1 Tax=Pedobacter lusitanus TaxID=1503925 RepID=A0A0D0F5N1_9SPHI|nr:hypothetical protein [Pedobacter lusitanus]KIO76863.1 hypothetical protein TH53_12195 [Pedobacter lusitanus]
MIDGKEYVKTVKEYFSFLETEYNMDLSEEVVNGSFYYDVSYKDKEHAISVSYENAEDYLQVIIFILHNGKLPNYDDKTKTLHLNRFNSKILSTASKSDLSLNNEYFLKFESEDGLKRKLLKSAKELRLFLKYFNDLNMV